jgi:hypothetical protein
MNYFFKDLFRRLRRINGIKLRAFAEIVEGIKLGAVAE